MENNKDADAGLKLAFITLWTENVLLYIPIKKADNLKSCSLS